MTNEVTVSDDNFIEEVIESEIPVLVDFWAEWCGPCKVIAPVLEEIAEDYAGKVKVAKVDIDNNADLTTKYNIASIPTLLLIKDGEEVKRQRGAIPRETIIVMFADYL